LIQLAPSYTVTLDFPAGYSRHEIEDRLLRQVWSTDRPFVVSLTPEADSGARLVFLTADFVTFAKSPGEAAQAKPVKCVVWDLDNTLWKGTLVEGDTVALRPEALPLLKHLDERGILLSIASKNDYAAAWQKLEELGIDDYFLYPQINWAPKSESVKSIAKRLNIGLDSLAFVDDSRFELEEVARAVPGVLCLGAEELTKLFDDQRFRGSTSAEARQRREMYRQSIAREIASEQSGTDYEAFLASCEISLEIASYAPADHERVAELVQRTNQLNFSGCKYTRTQLTQLLADSRVSKLVLRCADKFGSYGTVGFALVENSAGLVQVHDFMLSCRVQGKSLERAFFHHLLDHHNQECSAVLWVNFRPTERNSPARQVLESLGFRKCDPERSGLPDGMFLAVDGAPHCDFIRVTCTTATQAGASSPPAGERRGIGNA
jgi:FkbH-like protein